MQEGRKKSKQTSESREKRATYVMYIITCSSTTAGMLRKLVLYTIGKLGLYKINSKLIQIYTHEYDTVWRVQIEGER